MTFTDQQMERGVDQEIARVNREAINPATVPCPEGCGRDVEPTLLSSRGVYFDPPGTTIPHHCDTDTCGCAWHARKG